VLWIDTDVPVPSLADTLRIEVVEPDGSASSEPRVYVRPNPSDWPVSLGIARREDGEHTRLRLRLYEASHIAGRNPSEYNVDLDPDEPLPTFVVDRIVEIAVPEAGVRHNLVILHGDCMGYVADLEEMRTCIASGLEPRAAPNVGVTTLDGSPDPDAPPRPGTWDTALATPCAGEPRADSGLHDDEVCIEGGIFFLGDGRLGVNADVGVSWASIPERLVRLSPFYMDRHEVTVGRFNDAIDRGFEIQTGELVPRSVTDGCYFTPDGSMDDFPVNCISKELAEAFCRFDGGRALPTEAQWEYAATSGGRETMYVWGDRLPTCEDAVFARIGRVFGGGRIDTSLGGGGQCAYLGEGPQPVGSMPNDRTAHGVMDLDGNLQEWTRDTFIALTDECWDSPFLEDPVCDSGSGTFIVKGGIWSGVLGSLPLSLRKGMERRNAVPTEGEDYLGGANGFRCVRDGS
jgi:formylglycine-generating enzyme required for sulfatase activity